MWAISSKAKHIHETCKILVEQYNSEVPRDFDTLVTLPGVGRKTANVLVSILFDTPAIAVDTHVFRVSNRLGIAKGKTPDEVEKKLKKSNSYGTLECRTSLDDLAWSKNLQSTKTIM